MTKKSTGLYIDNSLHAQIDLIAHREKRSWNQMAVILLERGIEAQPSEVDDLVAAAREIEWVGIEDVRGNPVDVCPHCWQKKPTHADSCGLRAALAPFGGSE